MPVYHSKFNSATARAACGCLLLPIQPKGSRGVAVTTMATASGGGGGAGGGSGSGGGGDDDAKRRKRKERDDGDDDAGDDGGSVAESIGDVVDEAIVYFRGNVLFRKYEIMGGADRVLVYLTLFIHQILKVVEASPSHAEGTKRLNELAVTSSFALPGEVGWPLGAMFPAAATRDEADAAREFLRRAREATVSRLLDVVYYEDGTPNKWWLAFAKRKFMGKELLS